VSFAVYHPACITDAVTLASQFGEQGMFLAGGTDLVIQINRKRLSPQHLIDITRLAELCGVTDDAQTIRIGALTTHKAVERNPLFQTSLRALPEAARVVGGHQVRNVGTIGGNIANASPAADTVVPLLALEAELALVGPTSRRRVLLEQFLLGPGRTQRSSDELLHSVHISHLPDRSATAFLKAGRRKAMEISVVCVAARITLDEGGRCVTARIALGAVNTTAFRPRNAERALEGRALTPDILREAGTLAANACNPIDDVRASARYRRLLVGTLVPRAIERSLARIAEAGG
jgi:carbon-monoxide dehydrogenase medium subunit